MNKSTFKRFDVLDVRLDPSVGSEVKKTRPCLVVSPDEMNDQPINMIMVVPITSKKRNLPTRVKIPKKDGFGISVESYAMVDQIRSISKDRVVQKLGTVSSKYGEDVLDCLLQMFQ